MTEVVADIPQSADLIGSIKSRIKIKANRVSMMIVSLSELLLSFS